MRKIYAIFLSALLGFNSFGLFFFFWGEIQLCKIKAEDYSGEQYSLPQASLTLFSSGNPGFHKINDHEISSEGKLYDIVKTVVREGKTIYITYHDKNEDEFSAGLSLWGKSNSQENSLPGKSITIQLAKFFTRQNQIAAHHLVAIKPFARKFTINDGFLYSAPALSVEVPPPDCV